MARFLSVFFFLLDTVVSWKTCSRIRLFSLQSDGPERDTRMDLFLIVRPAYLLCAIQKALGRRRAPKTAEKLHTSLPPFHSTDDAAPPPEKKAISP